MISAIVPTLKHCSPPPTSRPRSISTTPNRASSLSQQLGKHDQVALLEDAQAQRHVREQHRVEREHCQDRHAPRQPPGSNRCPPTPDEPAHSSRSRITPSASSLPSRVKTNMSSWTTARRLATRSTRRLCSVVVSSEVVRPSARRSSSRMRSTRRSSSESSSRAWAGDWPEASRDAYACGCLTFHQRTPPTWL